MGGTGLVGAQIVQRLRKDPAYETVTLLVRRSIDIDDPKVRSVVVDFDAPEEWKKLVVGDVLFSALGTTLKVAGSKEAQYRVDHDYQLWAAEGARQNGVSTYVLISAAGASASSKVFYSRMKGELEDEVMKLGFASCNILRPGILDGDRIENRPGERFALSLLKKLPAWTLPASARPSPGGNLAEVCIRADQQARPGVRFIDAGEILESLK